MDKNRRKDKKNTGKTKIIAEKFGIRIKMYYLCTIKTKRKETKCH